MLRVQGELGTAEDDEGLSKARQTVLNWISAKIPGLPTLATGLQSFDHNAKGRTCSAIRSIKGENDLWALRLDEPDSTVADRVWSTEIEVQSRDSHNCTLTLRLLAASREEKLNIEPATPAVVRSLIDKFGLRSGDYSMSALPTLIRSEQQLDELVQQLTSAERTTPIFVLTGSEYAANEAEPLIDATFVSKMTAGIASVFIVPASLTRRLTHHLSKPLSVFEGAIRVYRPGFTLESDPYGGHELILPSRLATQSGKTEAIKRLQWVAALQSLWHSGGSEPHRFTFARLKAVHLQERQVSLASAGASASTRLEAALSQVSELEEQLTTAEATQQWLSDEHSEAQRKAEAVESQLQKYAFRIQQLTSQLKEAGKEPDADIAPPDSWDAFPDWCDSNLSGRVQLTPQARRTVRAGAFEDLPMASRCLLWLANSLREARIAGGDGSLRDVSLEEGVWNSQCGGDTYQVKWRGQWEEVDWHIKSGGNSREPRRCLRIYYFWDEDAQQVVVDWLPSHHPNGS